MKGARVTLIRAPAGRRERRRREQRLGAWNRVVPPKHTSMGTKRQDPMAICFTNRTKGAPTLVEYSQHVLAMGCSQASRSVSAEHSCVETGSQEPMAIYFTSGTTASPKMAQHSQSSLGTDYTLCGRTIQRKLLPR
ncbi:uncharacterized protein [Equus caballus]|uniref:uncharacterized protein isoform X1 n=2 Tax=Equus caballus TaxID=9796 RepID=UPI0038B3D50C